MKKVRRCNLRFYFETKVEFDLRIKKAKVLFFNNDRDKRFYQKLLSVEDDKISPIIKIRLTGIINKVVHKGKITVDKTYI